MTLSGIWDAVWADVTSRVEPSWAAVLVPLALVLVVLLVPALWRAVRHGVTIVHEAGHAVVAVLVGRRVDGIRLHRDTSGLTSHTGTVKRLPLTLVALSGYPAPGLVGLACAWALASGRALALLWVLLVALVVMLVQIRNMFGLLVMVVVIGGLGWLVWSAADEWRVGVAYGVMWLLLLGSVRAVVELHGSRRRGAGRDSDADALARLTRVRGGVWVAWFWLMTVACMGVGAWVVAGAV